MKYAVLIIGILGAGLFIYSVYAFILQPTQFKIVAYGFLGLAIAFFILVIIKKIQDERNYRKKISEKEK